MAPAKPAKPWRAWPAGDLKRVKHAKCFRVGCPTQRTVLRRGVRAVDVGGTTRPAEREMAARVECHDRQSIYTDGTR
jgi:hypothetical protein